MTFNLGTNSRIELLVNLYLDICCLKDGKMQSYFSYFSISEYTWNTIQCYYWTLGILLHKFIPLWYVTETTNLWNLLFFFFNIRGFFLFCFNRRQYVYVLNNIKCILPLLNLKISPVPCSNNFGKCSSRALFIKFLLQNNTCTSLMN